MMFCRQHQVCRALLLISTKYIAMSCVTLYPGQYFFHACHLVGGVHSTMLCLVSLCIQVSISFMPATWWEGSTLHCYVLCHSVSRAVFVFHSCHLVVFDCCHLAGGVHSTLLCFVSLCIQAAFCLSLLPPGGRGPLYRCVTY